MPAKKTTLTDAERAKRMRGAAREIGKGEQSKAFIKAARELGCDEDPAHFDEILKKVARHKSPPNAPPEPKKPKMKNPASEPGF